MKQASIALTTTLLCTTNCDKRLFNEAAKIVVCCDNRASRPLSLSVDWDWNWTVALIASILYVQGSA